jgi:hypothetical protein
VEVALSAMQVLLVLAEHPWLVVLILVVLVLRLRFVRATAYIWVLRRLGESKVKCRELITRAMKRDLNLRDPP